MSVLVNEGTETAILTTLIGGTETQIVRLDVGTGTTASNFGGTILNLNFGTTDTFYRHPDAFATVVSSGTSVMGTIKAGVAGSAIYVTDLIVSVGSASNVEIGNGGTDLPLIGTLSLAANGGAIMNFRTPINTSAGSSLVYKQSANIPLSISCQGYVD